MKRPRSRFAPVLAFACAVFLGAPGAVVAQTTTTDESTTSTTDTTSTTEEPTTSTSEEPTTTTETTTTEAPTTQPTTSTTETTTSTTEEPTTTSSSTSIEPTTTSVAPTTTSTSTVPTTTSSIQTTTSTQPTTSTTTTTSPGATTSTTRATSTTTPSTTTTLPSGENCTNGIDDDGDQLVDCADPDCLGNPACPPVCSPMPTFTGVECRLGALLGTVQTTPNIDLQRAKLVIMLSGTGQAEAAARVACASGDVKGTRRGLKKAGNRVRQFLSRLRRPSVKRSIPPLLRADFIENGDGIRSTLKTLRMTVACPGDATS